MACERFVFYAVEMVDAARDRLVAKLEELAGQDAELERELADPAVMTDHERVRDLSIRRAALDPVVSRYRAWRDLQDEIAGHEALVAEEGDGELAALAREELPGLRERAAGVLDEVSGELVTADDRRVAAVMLEVRAGAGGAEAALWAGDLLKMYEAWAGGNKWKFEGLELSEGEQGGLRHAVVRVSGEGVWQGLGYEGGVHCVKRVPATETQGRIHTSTATVAVLPEPEKVELVIPESDVTMHVTTAQGPGGQNVNKVATAVHLVHDPTGIEVRMQETKSQQQNREKAWALLRARVHDHMQRQRDAQRAEARSEMIGRGRPQRADPHVSVQGEPGGGSPAERVVQPAERAGGRGGGRGGGGTGGDRGGADGEGPGGAVGGAVKGAGLLSPLDRIIPTGGAEYDLGILCSSVQAHRLFHGCACG